MEKYVAQFWEGDAVINPNEFLAINKPFLRQRTYGGETYKGLEFTGTEYLQINGSTVSDAYGVPEPIFSTGGTSWQGNTGASFLFVIDQSPDYTAGTYTSPVQSLFYSRQPNLQGSPLRLFLTHGLILKILEFSF